MWHWGLKDPMLSTRNGTSGMKVCPECHGQGRIEEKDGNIVTCPECRGSGVVGYNVQVAVDTEHHLIVTHEVTNTGSDRAHLAKVASQAKTVLGADSLDVVADRGYFNSPEILACAQADITVTLPKPMTSGAKSDGRFGKQDFVYQSAEDVYRCPAGEK